MLLLLGAVYAVSLRLPYCNLDSDAVNFGLMGEDIYKYGHWTTLAYGQNYLLSITPYLYAGFKAILPRGKATKDITLAGAAYKGKTTEETFFESKVVVVEVKVKAGETSSLRVSY